MSHRKHEHAHNTHTPKSVCSQNTNNIINHIGIWNNSVNYIARFDNKLYAKKKTTTWEMNWRETEQKSSNAREINLKKIQPKQINETKRNEKKRNKIKKRQKQQNWKQTCALYLSMLCIFCTLCMRDTAQKKLETNYIDLSYDKPSTMTERKKCSNIWKKLMVFAIRSIER